MSDWNFSAAAERRKWYAELRAKAGAPNDGWPLTAASLRREIAEHSEIRRYTIPPCRHESELFTEWGRLIWMNWYRPIPKPSGGAKP